jgi:hypothetical protein
MRISRFFLLAAIFPLALAFISSCSSDDSNGGGGTGGDNQYCYIEVYGEGVCGLIGTDGCVYDAATCKRNYDGVVRTYAQCLTSVGDSNIDNCDDEIDDVPVNCEFSGGMLCMEVSSAEICQATGGQIVSECGSPNPPSSNNDQYCYFEEYGEKECYIIGTADWCLENVAECIEYDGVVKTYAQCLANAGVSNIFSCEY